MEKGHKITGVLKGSLSEDVFQDRSTIAGSVHVDAVNNGGEGDGIQAYTAIKEILLAVEESKIALTPDGIQLQVGESTVIRLSKGWHHHRGRFCFHQLIHSDYQGVFYAVHF
ncbi:Rhs element Vgr protein [Escherichia coli]|nr:Rhs element Vgr protein [Escherichia coli]